MIVKWTEQISANTETNAIVQYEDVTPTLVDIAGGKVIDGLQKDPFELNNLAEDPDYITLLMTILQN